MFLIIAINITAIYSCFAQFDDKFYFPSKEWRSIENIDFREINFHIDNDTINTILFRPKTTPKATIIYYHGTGGNISLNVSMARLLTDQGFQVFMIDFRGYGKSTGKPTHINIANDAQIIFDKITVKDELINYPIVISGASIGTQIAAKIARDNKDKISALILDGAMSSFTEMALLSAPKEQKEIIATYVRSPYSAMEDVKYLESIPKLFIHSKGDRSIPFSQGLGVYSNAPEPKTFWEYEGGHLRAASKHKSEYIKRINLLFSSIEPK